VLMCTYIHTCIDTQSSIHPPDSLGVAWLRCLVRLNACEQRPLQLPTQPRTNPSECLDSHINTSQTVVLHHGSSTRHQHRDGKGGQHGERPVRDQYRQREGQVR